jgi:type I restriction enzyme S subunit
VSDLPKGWVTARLDELLAPEPAAITDGPFGSNLKTEHYQDSGPRVIRLQNIGDGAFRDERAHISVERFQALGKHEARAGDIIVAALGETLPRACLVPPGLGPAIVKADCIRVRLHPEMDARFVSAMLNSPPVRKDATAQISGVGRPRLNLAKIRSIRLPVPPLKEQERIVAAIEVQFSRLDAAEQLLRSARRRAGRMRASALAAVTPADCKWTTLGEIAEIVGGVTKDSKRQADPSFVEMPYLRVANVQRGYLDLRDVTTIRVSPEKAKALRLEPGDILFNEGGDRDKLGRGWIWQGEIDDCIHQNHVFRARLLTNDADPKYVSLHGNTFGQQWFEKMGKQTTNLASINLKTLKSFPVPDLPVEEQHRIVAEVERRLTILESLSTAIDHALTRSDHLRRSILEAAFAGKLVPQVPDDEPAFELLARIASDHRKTAKPRRRRRA